MRGKPSTRLTLALIATALLLLLAAGPVWYARHRAEQRRFQAWVEARGGLPIVELAGPVWLNKRLSSLGLSPIERTVGVTFRNPPPFSEEMGEWRRPQTVTGFTDADVPPLAALKHLKELNLYDSPITDEGLGRVVSATRPDILVLDHTPITDAGLTHLAAISNLRELTLNHTAISDAGLAPLAGLKKLEKLELNDTRVTDAGLAHLRALTNLKELFLCDARIAGGGLSHLSDLKNLRILWLSGTQVTDAGLAHLRSLPHLEELALYDTPITDVGLTHLAGLTHLTFLGLRDTRVTKEGLARLRKQFADRGQKVGMSRSIFEE